MNLLRNGLAFSLAIVATATFAHGDNSQSAKKHAFDASKVEQRAFGREGDPRKVTRTIQVLKRGETVKFVVSNSGKSLHEMVLGTPQELKEHAEMMKKFPNMEHADANMAHVKAGAKGEIVWQFNKAGEYQFACLIPGHFEAGMIGKVVVK
jgi:uncharacterized cupredoxin-like copper-binding protein